MWSDLYRDYSRRWLYVSLSCVLLFVADLAIVESDRFINLEVSVRNSYFVLFRDTLPFNALPALHAVEFVGVASRPYWASVALFGGICAATMGALLAVRRFWSSFLLISAVLGALALTAVTKAVTTRPLNGQERHTFPSGHALISFVLCGVLIYLLGQSNWRSSLRQVGTVLVLVLGVLYGLSALTFHYPTEVLGGYTLGGAWVSLLLAALSSRLRQESNTHRN